jgi:hypothetical protein
VGSGGKVGSASVGMGVGTGTVGRTKGGVGCGDRASIVSEGGAEENCFEGCMDGSGDGLAVALAAEGDAGVDVTIWEGGARDGVASQISSTGGGSVTYSTTSKVLVTSKSGTTIRAATLAARSSRWVMASR